MMLRVYYQPDLNPLVRYHKTYFIKTNLPNYTISTVFNMDSGWSNSSFYPIYANFTWKNTAGVVTTVLTDAPPIIDIDIWNSTHPVGWWSYNGTNTAPGQTDVPTNVGVIPTYSGGTITGPPAPDYTIQFVQKLEKDRHSLAQWLKGTYNGVADDIIETKGYIVTYKPVDIAAEPVMEEKATKLRNPLEYTVGEQFEIPEFPFTGALMILVLLTALIGLWKLPALRRLKVRA